MTESKPLRVVFASAEVSPFAKTGGLGDVAGSLPPALARLGISPAVITPFHRAARQWFERNRAPLEPAGELDVPWSLWTGRIHILRAHLPGTTIPVYFVDHPVFDRPTLYAGYGGFDDDLERFAFFSRSVTAICESLAQPVDLFHTNDWHAALLNVDLHARLADHPLFRRTASVFTIHNLHYQGRYSGDRFGYLGLDYRFWPDFEYHGDVNMIKAGIVHADRVTAVSPSYAEEIRTPEGGAGLDGLMRHLSPKLRGILNGIDVDEWDPSADPEIAGRFSLQSMTGKATCKRELRREAGFRSRSSRLLIGVVSRLVDQKGFDLLLPNVPALLDAGCELVVLGSGESYYEETFRRLEQEREESVRVWLGFDPGLAHRIIAGSDLVMVPSRYEPCGLIQMQALRYGTLPLVRRVGGLIDSVEPYDGTNRATATGFGFHAPEPEELMRASRAALSVWGQRALWRRLRANGMTRDFSWNRSAREYLELYRQVVRS